MWRNRFLGSQPQIWLPQTPTLCDPWFIAVISWFFSRLQYQITVSVQQHWPKSTTFTSKKSVLPVILQNKTFLQISICIVQFERWNQFLSNEKFQHILKRLERNYFWNARLVLMKTLLTQLLKSWCFTLLSCTFSEIFTPFSLTVKYQRSDCILNPLGQM